MYLESLNCATSFCPNAWNAEASFCFNLEFFCTQDVSSVYTTNGYLGQMFAIKKITFWEKMGLKFFVLLLVGSGFNAHWICAMPQKLLLASLGQTVGMTFFASHIWRNRKGSFTLCINTFGIYKQLVVITKNHFLSRI